MRNVETIDVISSGGVGELPAWRNACEQVKDAIAQVDWPHGTGSFRINPIRHGNGVSPIKIPCIQRLEALGWRAEQLPQMLAGVSMGNLDALLERCDEMIGFEWETGNISSSHRAINKILLAILEGGMTAGILVVPSRALYPYLTDRIGNIEELRPYIRLWERIPIERGAFRIEVVEHDVTDSEIPAIPKGTDGRALR